MGNELGGNQTTVPPKMADSMNLNRSNMVHNEYFIFRSVSIISANKFHILAENLHSV